VISIPVAGTAENAHGVDGKYDYYGSRRQKAFMPQLNRKKHPEAR
jgi:hypothetical protein